MTEEEEKARKAMEATCKWNKSPKGGLLQTYNNAMLFIEENKYPLRYNEFSSLIEINGERYNPDIHSIQIKSNMRNFKLEMRLSTIDEAVMTVALKNRYHPVREYINGLKWDGVNRVDSWLVDMCGAQDSAYSRLISGISLVSAVRRVYEPGVQYDTMVIFEGDQGIGKSKLVRALGGEWYKSITLTDRDKDTVQLMQGAWFIEVAELAVFARREIESIKAFLSTPIDHARFAFGRGDRAYPRQSVFIGTINPESNGYLMDNTGNRRFMPIKLNTINSDMVERMRDQLIAEAFLMHKNGFKTYVSTAEMEAVTSVEQKKREYHDDWQDIILNYIHMHRQDMSTMLTAADVYQLVFGGRAEQYDKKISIRISTSMRKLGCEEPKPTHVGGISGKYFDISKIIEKCRLVDKVVSVGPEF